MSRIIGYSDNANHLLKSRPKGYSDGTNHPVKERWVGGADGANHKAWNALSVGDIYSLGGLTWKVLDISASGQATIMCTTSIPDSSYSSNPIGGSHWDNSTIRPYLNSTFYDSLTAENKSKIVPHTTTYRWYSGGYVIASVVDNVWLLSAGQCHEGYALTDGPDDKTLSAFVGLTDASRLALFGTGNMLRSVSGSDNNKVSFVTSTGTITQGLFITLRSAYPVVLINP